MSYSGKGVLLIAACAACFGAAVGHLANWPSRFEVEACNKGFDYAMRKGSRLAEIAVHCDPAATRRVINEPEPKP